MMWTESDSWRVAHWCYDYDAIPFVWRGEFGLQPVLMPHKVYPWREPLETTAESRRPKPSASPSPKDRP